MGCMGSLKFARLATLMLVAGVAGCASPPRMSSPDKQLPAALLSAPRVPLPKRLMQVAWAEVDGWQEDALMGATTALRENCLRVKQLSDWKVVCTAVEQLDELDPEKARAFYERYFTPFQLSNKDGSVDGLVTGYYEPLLRGSRVRRDPYIYPLYRWPQGMPKKAILAERAQLLKSGILKGAELVYVDDPIEAFFLQVQGSGRIVMEDGQIMRVGYSGSNGKPYQSIGRWLIDHGELTPAQATMPGIKAWARANRARVEAVLEVNPRFVFFKEMPARMDEGAASNRADGPIGALGVRLTAGRSIAVDPSWVALGMPVFLSTRGPTGGPLKRLVFAQDVGSAIKGAVRADYFWGSGDKAGMLAGTMKAPGRMWLLLPNKAQD